MIFALCVGCVIGLAWSSAQAAVPSAPELAQLPAEPPRDGRTVTLCLVASDGSPVSDAIDRISGRGGFSHCFLDLGHRTPAGAPVIVDYQPGAGVHFGELARYANRPIARVILEGDLGAELWGCIRARLGDPFDAAGALLGKTTLATCSGLIWGCLPLAIKRTLGGGSRPIAPNDLARVFGAQHGRTVRYGRVEPWRG